MPKNYCIMQIWAESGKSALPICNYSQILYQFLTFTQNLKRSRLRRIFSTSGNPFKLENNIYHIIGCGTRSTYNGVTGAISTNGSVVVAMFDGEYTHILLQYDAIPSASGSTQSGMFLIDILI